MSIKLGSNISALRALRELSRRNETLTGVTERLASGLRITHASSDAAGLSIATSLQADARIFSQAIRNVNDGISLLNIAESGVSSLRDLTSRIIELAEQSANGTYNNVQRLALDREAQALSTEYNRIVAATRFNGQSLLDGTFSSFTIQAGHGTTAAIALSLGNSLSRLVGDGTFGSAVSYSTGMNGLMISSEDLNGDGYYDLVTGAQGTSLAVLLGNGNGTFKARVNYTSGNKGSSSKLTVGDVNGDGKVDLITQNSYSNTVSVLIGNGDGTFKAKQDSSVTDVPYTSKLQDLNGDGRADLVVGTSAAVNVLFGNGNGTFTAAVSYAVGTDPRATEVVDINGDGNFDLVTPDRAGGALYILLGNGNGSFNAASSFGFLSPAQQALPTDLNGDGQLDLVLVTQADSTLRIHLGNGDGTFKASLSAPTAALTTQFDLVAGDFNDDGTIDLSLTSGTDGKILVYLGNGNGTFSASISYSTAAAQTRGMVMNDFNEDGALDLVSVDGVSSNVSILLGNTQEANTFPTMSLRTQSDARQALTTIADVLDGIYAEQGAIGAQMSRLDVATHHLRSQREVYLTAASRITDADIAQESADLVRQKILQQIGVAVLAQAKQLPALALTLLD